MAYEKSTVGFYRVGSVSATSGSATVNGSGTMWKDIVNAGDVLTVDDSKLYFVKSVESNTSLTLDEPVSTGFTGSTYRIVLNTAAHFPSDTAAKVEKALENLLNIDSLALTEAEVEEIFDSTYVSPSTASAIPLDDIGGIF